MKGLIKMKTKLGMSIGLMGALVYFAALFGGWIPVLLLTGYVCLYESNAWLKRTAITSLVLMVGFYALSSVLNLLPSAINWLDDLFTIFEGNVSLPILNRIVSFLNSTVDIVERVLFLVLGFRALSQGSFNLGFVDKFIDKHTKDN